MSQWIHIRGARVVDPATGSDEVRDVFLQDGRLVPVPGRIPSGTKEVAADGLVLAPGLMDLHVHFREPGGEDAETVSTGSTAAARGGFSTVVTMPNTRPPVDSAERVRTQLDLAARCGRVRVLPAGCITLERKGRALADLARMKAAGAVAFTDDGSTVSDSGLMRDACIEARRLGVPIMDHALDPELAGDGVVRESGKSRKLRLAGMPARAEYMVVERDVALARETGARLHVQHVSCAESVEMIREARESNLPVSCEATPHHLWFSVDDIPGDDANFKMNPPLGTPDDVEALRQGVVDGSISAFATDHAPHTASAKAGGMAKAPFGVIGLETAVGVTFTLLVKSGRMSLMNWLRRWTVGPAEVLGIPPPSLADGSRGDVVLLAPDDEWTVNASTFAGKSRNSPYGGLRLSGRVVRTFSNGIETFAAGS